MANGIIAFFTVVIALATIAYVVLTRKLSQETKKSADAAAKSADAAKQSADAAVEAASAAKQSADLQDALHRPFMGLSDVSLKGGWGSRYWDIAFVLKNYGTLPALNVGATMQFFTNDSPRTEKTEPKSVQVFPSSEHQALVRFDMGDLDRTAIHDGTMKLRIEAKIPYETEDGRKFEYTATVSHTPGRFAIDKSETHTIRWLRVRSSREVTRRAAHQ